MTTSELVEKLRTTIIAELAHRIMSDYWLLEVPYYNNVGDVLIWQGEMDFLRGLPFKCKGMRSCDSYDVPRIGEGDLVLFQGGGNFGDLWTINHEYKKKIMSLNPTCRFLIFPQTVYWQSEAKMRDDAEFFARYDCTICARDKASFELLRRHFKNEILLVPDMAFCMDMGKWRSGVKNVGRPLLLKRSDKEFRDSDAINEVMRAERLVDVTDWPTMVGDPFLERWKRHFYSRQRYLGPVYEKFCYHVYRPYVIRSGIGLLTSHTDVYTTRLHTCILAVLLGKEKIVFMDNSYGKNRGFYDTWMSECEAVEMR